MNLKASSSFKSGDTAGALARILLRAKDAVTDGANAVLDISRQYVPVDKGDLASSGGVEADVKGITVVAVVSYTSGHAAYNEFGTGKRGEESGHGTDYGTTGIEYSPTWPGMSGHPYLRPALDACRPDIIAAFADQGFTI